MNYKCPVCKTNNTGGILTRSTHGSEDFEGDDGSFKYARCKNCNCVYLIATVIDAKFYKKYYSKKYYPSDQPNKINRAFSKYTNFVKKSTIENANNADNRLSILDVGFGDGSFLKFLPSGKFDKFGIDSQENKVKVEGAELIYNDILSYNIDRKFDVITMWHVIEHVRDPIRLMNKLKRMLKKGGFIILSTPVTSGYGFKDTLSDWYHFDAPRHIVLYNDEAINILSKKTNLKLVKIVNFRYEFPLDLFWSYKKAGIAKRLSSFIKKVHKSETKIYTLR